MAAAAIATIPSFHNDFLESGNDFREITTTIAKDTNALEEIEASVAARYSQYNNDVSNMYKIWEAHKDKIEKYSRAGMLLRAREFNQRYLNLRQQLAEIVSSLESSPEDRAVAQNALLLSTGEPFEGEEEEDEYDLYSSDEDEEYDSDEEEDEEDYDENNRPQEEEEEEPQENNNPDGELEDEEDEDEDNEEEDEYYEENLNEDEIDFDEDDYSDYEEDDEEEE